ncbi:hypothetical protein OSB04_027799 [Centaurea solstitialis]|uniref:Reverse transcriptase zinc-binding domain-containing protein n=1 Tax=Centaurea solstitialis TaxID=347529 RepID=A0AA38SLY6_9ASTR|nr:hypothetical protein OSB04_027799 [Centaurea solstitialis]
MEVAGTNGERCKVEKGSPQLYCCLGFECNNETYMELLEHNSRNREGGELGININTLMHRKEGCNGWEWDLEANKQFTVLTMKMNGVVGSRRRLATRDNPCKRGVVLSSNDCLMCLAAAESLEHTFIRCSTMKIVVAHIEAWIDWWLKNVSST